MTGRCRRAVSQSPRRKLTVEQHAAIRALAATKSLRSLAADFGVSHETIRAVLLRCANVQPTEFLAAEDESVCMDVESCAVS